MSLENQHNKPIFRLTLKNNSLVKEVLSQQSSWAKPNVTPKNLLYISIAPLSMNSCFDVEDLAIVGSLLKIQSLVASMVH